MRILRAARRSRTVSNALFSSAEHALVPVLGLIATPIYLGALGIDQFGIWMLANSILGFSGVFGFGLTDATIRYVVKYRTAGDPAGVLRVIRSTWTLYGGLGLAGAVVVGALAQPAVEGLFRVPEDERHLAIVAIRIAGGGMVVRFLDSVLSAAIQGFERYDVTARVAMGVHALGTTSAIVAALLGAELPILMVIVLGGLGAGAVAKAWILRHRFVPGLRLHPYLDAAAVREVASFGVYSWFQGIGGTLFAHVDRFIVASVLGTAGLTYYTVPLQLAQQVHTLLARGSAFVFPLASAAHERGAVHDLQRIYVRGLRIVASAAVAIAVPLYVLAGDLLRLWVGTEVAAVAEPVLRVLAFATSLFAAGIVPYYVMNATGLLRLNTAFGLLGGAIVAGSSVVLTLAFGLLGAAAARLGNVPTDVVARTLLHRRILSDRRWYAGVTPVLPAIVVFVAAYLFERSVDFGTLGWAETAAFGVVIALAAGGLAYGVASVVVRAGSGEPERSPAD